MNNLDNDRDVNFYNVFLCYYKRLFQNKPDTNMFSGVDHEDDKSTNRCMELLYDEMYKYREAVKKDKTCADIVDSDSLNIDQCDELYLLIVDDDKEYVCQLLLPLIKFISQLESWETTSWSIMNLKSSVI